MHVRRLEPRRDVGRGRRRTLIAALALALALGVSPVGAESLREAMRSAYLSNPRLDAERARLRATDEEVPRALSGYRPTVSGLAEVGRQRVASDPVTPGAGTTSPWGYEVALRQPIFNGFRTTNAVHEAEATVRAGREDLRLVESQTLLDAVIAYLDVVRDTALLRLREQNVAVLTRELEAAEARRQVREVTRTDVAQTRARRARAVSAADVARADLKVSRATFERVVGHPAERLYEPPLRNPHLPRTITEALAIAEQESPNVASALYREAAARYSVERIRGELLPEVTLEASYQHRSEVSRLIDEQDTASVSGRVSVPFYQGGEVSARVRQAKHTHVSRLQEIEQARTETQANVTAAWSRLMAARAQLKSDEVQVEASRTALEGVREEEKVGQRTLLDVLNAEQELLDAQVALVATRRDLVVAGYALLAAMGRLLAEPMGLTHEIYDAQAHYDEVRHRWFGLSITHAGGRKEMVQARDADDEPQD